MDSLELDQGTWLMPHLIQTLGGVRRKRTAIIVGAIFLNADVCNINHGAWQFLPCGSLEPGEKYYKMYCWLLLLSMYLRHMLLVLYILLILGGVLLLSVRFLLFDGYLLLYRFSLFSCVEDDVSDCSSKTFSV